MLTSKSGLFRETIFRLLGSAGPWNFYTPYNPLKCIWSGTWGAGRPHVGLCPIFLVIFYFLTRHRISELRRPIAAKLCTVISIFVNFLMQVQKLGGSSPKKILPPLNFRSILHNFRLWSRISPERDKISKIGKTCDLKRFLPRSAKQLRWTLVHYPQSSTCEFGPTQLDFFRQTIFRPLGVLAPEIFTRARVWTSLGSAHRSPGRGFP